MKRIPSLSRSMTDPIHSFDLTVDDILEANRIYDPSLDGSIEEVFELIRDHNQITTNAELHHHLTNV